MRWGRKTVITLSEIPNLRCILGGEGFQNGWKGGRVVGRLERTKLGGRRSERRRGAGACVPSAAKNMAEVTEWNCLSGANCRASHR